MTTRSILLAALAAALAACDPGGGQSDPVAGDISSQYRLGPEARQWLAANAHPYALASNRFESTAEAIALVDALYAAGAERVVVAPDSIRAEPEAGGDYADTLIVGLPADGEARSRLVNLGRAEARRDGYALDRDLVEQGYLFLWWD